MTFASKILSEWGMLMTDEEKKDNGLHVNVDGGFNISKQAIWRTGVMIYCLVTGSGVLVVRHENSQLLNRLGLVQSEVADTKATTTRELTNFKSVIDDVINFLIEEKALQKTPAAKERYQKEIEKIRAKLKPIGAASPDLRANELLPPYANYAAPFLKEKELK